MRPREGLQKKRETEVGNAFFKARDSQPTREWVCVFVCLSCREKVDLTPYVMRHEFRVDFAFDETASTAAVYRQCVRPLVCCSSSGSGGPNGSCCSFFAYGQTGSGKTHTMLGPAASSGAEGTLTTQTLLLSRLVYYLSTSSTSRFGPG